MQHVLLKDVDFFSFLLCHNHCHHIIFRLLNSFTTYDWTRPPSRIFFTFMAGLSKFVAAFRLNQKTAVKVFFR